MDLIDTFPAFEKSWRGTNPRNMEDIRAAWEAYLIPWPELLLLQIEEYAGEGLDWRAEAAAHVFPFLVERLPAMRLAHEVLSLQSESFWQRARTVLGLEWEPLIVLYVGVGLGAGWATRFQNWPAVLFGLENIAEEGWTAPATLAGLFAHEVGHLAHADWRARAGLEPGQGAYWQLYEEGLAQACEHKVIGGQRWHMAGNTPGWLAWCREHTAWLAQEYLRRVRNGEDIRPFFGSWFDLLGFKQTGYYLGWALVARLEERLGWKKTICLEDVDTRVEAVLAEIK